jgi:hypothetical protein
VQRGPNVRDEVRRIALRLVSAWQIVCGLCLGFAACRPAGDGSATAASRDRHGHGTDVKTTDRLERRWAWECSRDFVGKAPARVHSDQFRCSSSPAPSPIGKEPLYGLVTDETDKPVVDAILIARHQSTEARFRATTNSEGVFRFRSLPSGKYDLSVKDGRVGDEWPDVVVEHGKQTFLRFRVASRRIPKPD